MKKNKIQLIHSVKFAFHGIGSFFLKERNGQIQLGITAVVIALAGFLNVLLYEWLIIVLFVVIVLTLEMINTALEKLCDVVQPDWHPKIKIIKDIAAGAVLLAAIGSIIAGILIFLPKILH